MLEGFVTQKGIFVLLKAFQEIIKINKDINLFIIGEGNEKNVNIEIYQTNILENLNIYKRTKANFR